MAPNLIFVIIRSLILFMKSFHIPGYFKCTNLLSLFQAQSYMDIGRDFARALAVVFPSIPVHNHPDTCDNLHA